MRFKSKSTDKPTEHGTSTENIGRWVAIGLCIGVTVGALIDNVGLGVSLGICFGAAIGSVTSEKTDETSAKKQPRVKTLFRDDQQSK